MAWEMQNHMFGYIGPSILSYLNENYAGEDDRRAWLLERLEDNLVDVWDGAPIDSLVDTLAIEAQNIATTTNGAHEFYLDHEGYTTIPWCTEDEMLAFY